MWPVPARRYLARLMLAALPVVVLGWPVGLAAQGPALMPLPPARPFDLDLPKAGTRPVVPATPVTPAAGPKTDGKPETSPPATAGPADAKANPRTDKASEEDDEEAPRFPRGLNPRAEPVFDPNEKPEQSGISTDPGTSIACLPPVLKGILGKIVSRYGAVKVTSSWRPAWRARRNSYHRRCQAMDFRVPGVRPREVLNFVRTLPETGGNKVYWNGLIHVDTGPRRSW
jgi:hypothetical protein